MMEKYKPVANEINIASYNHCRARGAWKMVAQHAAEFLADKLACEAALASLEAERDKAVELLRMSLHSGVGVQDYQLREHIESFLVSIGGEVKK